jgi:transposase
VESGLHQKAPRNWAKNITLLSSIGKRMGMGASLVVEGSTNRTVFETYLEDVLCPTLERGQVVVVMDNLSSHKGERVKELIEGRRCELIYLPPYSPDFNPNRASIQQAQELFARSVRSYPADTHGAYRRSSPYDHCFRCGGASSNIAVTRRWFNLYDRCSRLWSAKPKLRMTWCVPLTRRGSSGSSPL